jgi:hypothetical protein
MDLARAPRRARLTARKKGSGYENVITSERFCRKMNFEFWTNKVRRVSRELPQW